MSIVITYPYPLGKRITEEKLIRCGREKFLEKGYAEANERQIMKYICAHRQECELVLENAPAANTKPSGTRSSPTCRPPFRAIMIWIIDYS